MLRKLIVGFAATAASFAAHAEKSGTVSVEKTADAFSITFANHANETNGLWVAYGQTDCGEGTNGWDTVAFLGTVYPATTTWLYDVPPGWGDSVKAIRFILSEVPYDVDYTLAYLQNNQKNRICLSDFDFKGSYRLVTQMKRVSFGDGNPAFFFTRQGGNTAPYFGLFEIGGTSWRFDYNANSGAQKNTVALANDTDYLIDASWKGLVVNGIAVPSKAAAATYFSGSTLGKMEFFCGNQSAGTMGNHKHVLQLSWARIYDYLDASGNVKSSPTLLVDLVPAVKGGVVGAYDAVRKVFYSSDTGTAFVEAAGTRVESANPFFASALCKAKASGPEVFVPMSYTEDALSYTNECGGILNGPAALKLTGANDWGGRFTASNGILVAAFGKGLGAGDNLLLSGGAYGGFDGVATNAIGSGAGEISVAAGKYLIYAAVNGDLRVNIGGAGEPWTPTEALYRLAFKDPEGEGTVTFENPLYIPADGRDAILRNFTGKSVLAGNVTAESGWKFNLYGYGYADGEEVGETVFAGTTNTFATYYQESGGWTLGAGTTNVVNGNLVVKRGVFLATNAIVKATGALKFSSTLQIQGGSARFVGGEALFAGAQIGVSGSSQSTTLCLRPSLTLAGKVVLADKIAEGSYGSMTIFPSASGAALTLEDGADVRMVNLNFQQRNVYHNGGTLVLNGSYGLNQMGAGGSIARYSLKGGRLEAPKAIQSTVAGARAFFCFAGGTLANKNETDSFFENFGSNSRVDVAGAFGGTFEVNYDTAITNDITASEFYGNTWSYPAEKYMSAPAFAKTGKSILTLKGACSYNCATEIAAGALMLQGENATLPTSGVVRVTGGTLDLGGHTQPLKALCGTAGTVKNGAIVTTEGIYPGGKGAIGSFTNNVALTGTLFIDVTAEGAADSLVTTETLDLANLDLVISAPETMPETADKLRIIDGAYAGRFRSVTGLPAKWEVAYRNGHVAIGRLRGLSILIR